ncbi:MAG: hypothetical protein WAL38_11980, partial [Solirubrobacteraceae bacterium]
MSSVSSWTIFDSDVERLDETPAFLGEQKYDLAGACWDSANPRCRLGRQAHVSRRSQRPVSSRSLVV